MHAAAGTGGRALDAPQTSRPAAQLQALLARNHRQLSMELAGLEPATSWVRSRRSPN